MPCLTTRPDQLSQPIFCGAVTSVGKGTLLTWQASEHWAWPDAKDTLRAIAEMDECDAKKKERMEKVAAKKKALVKKEAVDSEPRPACTAEGTSEKGSQARFP